MSRRMSVLGLTRIASRRVSYYHRSSVQELQQSRGEEGRLHQGQSSCSFSRSFPVRAHQCVFIQFIADAKAKQSEEKESRLRRIRGPFRSLLSDHPAIYSYSTFKTAEVLFAGNSIWLQAKGEEERRALFDEYIAELKQKELVSSVELFDASGLHELIFPFPSSPDRVSRAPNPQHPQAYLAP